MKKTNIINNVNKTLTFEDCININYNNTISGLTADNVQDAIDEVFVKTNNASCNISISCNDGSSPVGQIIMFTETANTSNVKQVIVNANNFSVKLKPNTQYIVTTSIKEGYISPNQIYVTTGDAGSISIVNLEYKKDEINITFTINFVTPTVKSTAIGQNILIKRKADGIIKKYLIDTNPKTIQLATNTEFEISLEELEGHSNIPIEILTSSIGTSMSFILEYLTAEIYGIKIDKNNSDPDTSIEYTNGALGFTPAYMDFENNEFNYGSFEHSFFVRNARPCMLRYDGIVDYYLNPNDYSLKEDGTVSDVSNESYAGNAMVEIPLIYIKQYSDATHHHYIISNKQIDVDFKALAFTADDGITIRDKVYVSMFEGYHDGTKIRSLADKEVSGGLFTRQEELDKAKGNGSRWGVWYYSIYNTLNILSKILFKSSNIQKKLGEGLTNTVSLSQTGTLKTKGAFYGSNLATVGVKMFHIENLYGNLMSVLTGLVVDADKKMLIKTHGPYNIDGTGYTNTNVYVPDGYISQIKIDNEIGSYPLSNNGSSTTYTCDYYYSIANGFALCGGSIGNQGQAGLGFLNIAYTPDRRGYNIGASLVYL